MKQRLLNRSKIDKRPFNELLQYYAMERFLYRLSLSPYSGHYILKGALMLRVWNSSEFRPTMDIDVLGKTENEEQNILYQIQRILSLKVEPDGLTFDTDSLHAEGITENTSYKGFRITFRSALGTARIKMQIDIGFGDIVYPGPEESEFPCILNFPAPTILCYSRESVIAEKFEAIVKLGYLNSRMKDFYDIWLLSRQFPFEICHLAEAIKLTFRKRDTDISQPIDAFSKSFIQSRQTMWAAFIKGFKHNHIPASFQVIVNEIELFLAPIIQGSTDTHFWKPAGPWL